MDNNYDTIKSFMCRLCLRLYSNDELVEIFNSESTYEQEIFDAVGVQPLPEDPTTSICMHCRHIISLINTFKITCVQADILLKNNSYALESDTWSILQQIDIFQQAAELIEIHQQDIDAISRKDPDIYNEVEYDPANSSPKSESIISNNVEYLIENVLVDDDQSIKIESSDTEAHNLNTDSSTFDNQADNDVKIESESSDSFISHKKSSDKIPTSTKKRIKSKIKRDKVICTICGELVTRHGIEGHHNRHLGVKPFACEVPGCKTRLHSKTALRQHRSRHKSGNRFYDCTICNKRIKGTASWLMHRKLHTEEPQIACDICGKKFRRRYKLKIHSTVHTGIADHKCDICGKAFTVKHNLKMHYKVHMKAEPTKSLKDKS